MFCATEDDKMTGRPPFSHTDLGCGGAANRCKAPGEDRTELDKGITRKPLFLSLTIHVPTQTKEIRGTRGTAIQNGRRGNIVCFLHLDPLFDAPLLLGHKHPSRESGLGTLCRNTQYTSVFSRMRPTLACAAAAAAAVQCCSAFSVSHPAAVPAATGSDRASSFTSTTVSQGISGWYQAARVACLLLWVQTRPCACVCDTVLKPRQHTCVKILSPGENVPEACG